MQQFSEEELKNARQMVEGDRIDVKLLSPPKTIQVTMRCSITFRTMSLKSKRVERTTGSETKCFGSRLESEGIYSKLKGLWGGGRSIPH